MRYQQQHAFSKQRSGNCGSAVQQDAMRSTHSCAAVSKLVSCVTPRTARSDKHILMRVTCPHACMSCQQEQTLRSCCNCSCNCAMQLCMQQISPWCASHIESRLANLHIM
jgi:hypothetical protein